MESNRREFLTTVVAAGAVAALEAHVFGAAVLANATPPVMPGDCVPWLLQWKCKWSGNPRFLHQENLDNPTSAHIELTVQLVQIGWYDQKPGDIVVVTDHECKEVLWGPARILTAPVDLPGRPGQLSHAPERNFIEGCPSAGSGPMVGDNLRIQEIAARHAPQI